VLTAVFVSVVGALWVARMIAWEVENARQRADFAANVSHELRSPITQIRLKGEALQLGLVEPGEDMEQHFAAIVRESERLSRLVDNVLDFAAIERGAKRYQLRPDDLAAVVVASVEAARPSLEALGMRVVLEVADDLPRLPLDRDAIGQVLTNLLSNAAKYAADGRYVAVRVEQGDDAALLSVEDRGIGISAEELPRVFDDFFRSTDPKVRRTKGTGIGLAIVRYIVEAHGGTISVESQVGRGSVFTIVLPFEEPGNEETA
jgi:two-component system phosphate regulon sensor histidine kinase PhoR